MKMSEDKDSAFDRMANAIQQEIEEGEVSDFSRKVIEEYRNPKNVGRMTDADAFGIITGPCGDTMEFYLRIKDSRVTDVLFMTDGCGSTIACGSMLTKIVKGIEVGDAEKLTAKGLVKALDGLPEANKHCAKLAVDTLKEALKTQDTRMK